MEEQRDPPKRPWDTCQEVPITEDEQTPWKMIKLLKFISFIAVAIFVFGLALCSKINFVFFIVNAFWLVATFMLQSFSGTFSIHIPKFMFNQTNSNETLTRNGDILIEPIGFMFILGFGVSVLIQFLAMFYHRIYTLIHYVAFVDTEPKEKKKLKKQDSYLPGKKDDSRSNADSNYSSMGSLDIEDSDAESEFTTGYYEEDQV